MSVLTRMLAEQYEKLEREVAEVLKCEAGEPKDHGVELSARDLAYYDKQGSRAAGGTG